MFKHLNTRIPKRIEQEKDKVSAVMIPLIKKNDGYHILFEVRSNKLSQQPGEICFPGGRREHDETSMEASIRETCEELLISESRLIVADFMHLEQKSIAKRLLICIPIFAVTIGILLYSQRDAAGFDMIWRYFAWCNQALSVFTLWAVTVFLVRAKKNYYITLFPALFMTAVCSTYICIAPEGLALSDYVSYIIGGLCTLVAAIGFVSWYRKQNSIVYEKI